MERGNTKHGVVLDDQMQHETRAAFQGGPNSRVDEGRDPQDVGATANWEGAGQRSGGAPAGMTADDVESRSTLGRYIPKASLPGDRDDLLAGASEMNAPDEVLAVLERLPEGEVYDTVNQVWAALGGPNEDPARRP